MGAVTEFDGELDAELIKAIDGFADNVAAQTRATRQTLDKVSEALEKLSAKPGKRKFVFSVVYHDNTSKIKNITATEE